jgi:hypothetical protein
MLLRNDTPPVDPFDRRQRRVDTFLLATVTTIIVVRLFLVIAG